MPTESKALLGFLALAVAHSLGRRSVKKKFTQVVEELSTTTIAVFDENRTLHDEISYLVHVLNDRGVALDDFDLIALPHVNVK